MHAKKRLLRRAFADLRRIFCYPSEQGAPPATSDAPRGGDSRTLNAIFGQVERRKSLFSVAQAMLAKGCSCEACIGLGICGAEAFWKNENLFGGRYAVLKKSAAFV